MSLGLILGRAGSGKTETCIRQIGLGLVGGEREEFVLLTPEQASFANEKRILETLGNTAGFRVKVLSFRRLVHWVLQETGGGLLQPLDSPGKNLILRYILEKRKQDLRAFGLVWDKKGFIGQLAELMDELRTYQARPEAMIDCLREKTARRDIAGDLDSRLADIRMIFDEYEAFLARGWLDHAGELTLLCQKLPEWRRLARTSFWLDGFHGFTPAEFGVIRCILAAGCKVKATLNLPEGEEDKEYTEDELFYPTWETARDLRKICRENGYTMEATVYPGEPGERRFAASPGLAALEKALSGQSRLRSESIPSGEGPDSTEVPVSLESCGDMRQEVERLAVEIIEAARDEKMRYQDMAVLLRSPKAYESLIQSIFPSYDIPFFFDGPKPLRRHPLIGLIRELTAIMKDKWNTGTLMSYTKTGFSGITDNQGFALENYCLAHGVKRMHWESPRPWRFTSTEDPQRETADRRMEGIRQKLWKPLDEFRRDLEKARSAEETVTAVYRHLKRLKAEQTCSRMANEAMTRGEPETAQIHQRAWQELMKLFDQTAVLLTRRGETGEEAGMGYDSGLVASVWESALESMEMAALPPSLDQVVICSMDRSRSPLAKKVWVPGVNEGVLPANIKDEGLLSADDRRWFAERKIQLAPDSRRRIFSESYLIYIALTRASKSLSISCARADTQGISQAPSVLLDQIRDFFPGLTVREAEPAVSRRLVRPGVCLPYLGMALQNGKTGRESLDGQNEFTPEMWEGLWRYVYHWFSGRTEYVRDLERLRQAYDLAPLGRPLTAALAGKIFGGTIRTSITRLELFQACPFAHYLAYGLALEQRDEYEVQPPNIGNFFHDSLQALMEEVKSAGLRLGELDRGGLDKLVEIITERQLENKSHEIFLSTSWYRTLSSNLLRILQSSARSLAYQESRGSFLTHAMETDFGFDHQDSLPPVVIDIGERGKILLRGRIDRIDRAVHPDTGENLLRIVDYKSGNNDLSLYEVYYGLKLQLILYMEAALEAYPQDRPAGLFYFRVHDPIITAANATEASNADLRMEKTIKAQALRGYLLSDRDVIKMMDSNYGESLFLPVSEKKTGDFGIRSKLIDDRCFRQLGEHGRKILASAGKRIMEGDISLTPYQTKLKTACDYCPYNSVCRFDPGIAGHSYRYLPALPDDVVKERLDSR